MLNKLKIENIFLLIGLCFGILFTFVTPIFQVPDEPMHLVRTCEVSNLIIHNNKDGDFTKDIFPNRKKLLNRNCSFFKNLNNQKHYTDLLEFKELNYTHNNSGYSFIMYLPSAICLKITSQFTKNPYIIFYLLRLSNLCTWLFLTYYAIKLTPFKWQFLTCALFPMTLYEGMSISADSINLGFAFIFVAFIFNLKYLKKIVNLKDIIILSILTITSTLFKGISLFAFLIFLIPEKKFKLKYAIMIPILFITMLLQIFISKHSYILIANVVDFNIRKLMIINEPLYVAKLFFNTLLHKSSFYLQSSIFRLGWLDIKPNPIPVFLLFFAYISGTLLDKVNTNYKERFFILGLNFLFIILTTLLYFLTFSPLDNNIIIGTQGRYFIPLFLTFCIAIQNPLRVKKGFYIKLLILITILINLLYACYLILNT